MPELPDVAVFKGYVESTSLHQDVERVEVLDQDVLQEVTHRKLSSVLESRQFASAARHGKHLFIKLSGEGYWLELHFGMTGRLKYYKRAEQRPEYARLIFHFTNHFGLAYVTQRKLGHVSLESAPDERIEELNLGPDALDGFRDWKAFYNALAGSRGTIKGALMAQDKLAGIGNVYSDEILYHAHIHPKTAVAKLAEQDFKTLYRCRGKVLKTAIERKVDVEKMPRTWLLPHRDDGQRCPRCGQELKTTKISGRTSHFCENCQSPKYGP